MKGSNFNIDGMLVLGSALCLIPLRVPAPVSWIASIIPHFVEFFGFGRGRHGILNQGGRRLNVRNGFGNNILGQRIADNRRWNGRNLHVRPLNQTAYYTSVLNNPLRVSCKNF